MKRTVSKNGKKFEYVLVRSQRQDVLLKALPGGETRVYAPSTLALRRADELVLERLEELERMHARLEEQLRLNRLRHPVGEGSRKSSAAASRERVIRSRPNCWPASSSRCFRVPPEMAAGMITRARWVQWP